MRPISIVMISDGIPDVNSEEVTDIRSINVQPLERLARSTTIRLLYTDPVTGKGWQTRVKRQRVKIWTQDAEVMKAWKDSTIMVPGKPLEEQSRFFDWVKDNVDFGVRSRRVT
jgi:plasmid replication initiation protein